MIARAEAYSLQYVGASESSGTKQVGDFSSL
jgi:hypothetical protein